MLTRSHIVAETRSWIGTPYRHQASLKGVGCDCLGLVRGVWRELMGEEPERAPPYSPDWAEALQQETLAQAAARHLIPIAPDQFLSGDVLLFRWRAHLPAKHAAIVTTADLMVHAHDGAAVTEVAIAPWWRRRLAYAFAFPGLASGIDDAGLEKPIEPDSEEVGICGVAVHPDAADKYNRMGVAGSE